MIGVEDGTVGIANGVSSAKMGSGPLCLNKLMFLEVKSVSHSRRHSGGDKKNFPSKCSDIVS